MNRTMLLDSVITTLLLIHDFIHFFIQDFIHDFIQAAISSSFWADF
jgi:hypothetical protein